MWNIVLISTILVTLQLSVHGDVSHLVGQQGHNHHHHEHHDHPGYSDHKPSNPLEPPGASTDTHGTSHPGYPKEKPKKPFNIQESGSTGNIVTEYLPPITDSTGASTGGVKVQTTHGHHEHHYHGEDGKYNPHDDGRGWDIRKSVPGEPEVDYPTLASVPRTTFTCSEKAPGYYADTETRCQAFRICTTRSSNAFTSFLCPNGTLFNQNQLTCDWWNNVDCEHSDQYYYKNNEIGKMPEGPQLMYEINKMLQAPFQFSQNEQHEYHKYETDNQIQGTAENQQGVYLPPKVTTTQATYHHQYTHQESSTAGYKYPKPKPTPNQLHLQKEFHQQQQQQQHHYHQEQHQHVPQQQHQHVPQQQYQHVPQQQHQHIPQQPQIPQQHQHVSQQQHQHVPQQQHQHVPQQQYEQVPQQPQEHQQHQIIQTSIDNSQQHSQNSDSSSSSSINLPVAPVYGVPNQVGEKNQDKKTISTIPLEHPRLPDEHESHTTTTTSKPYVSTTVSYSSTTLPSSTTIAYKPTVPSTTYSTTVTYKTTVPSSTTTPSSTTIPSSTTPKLHLSQISKPSPQPLFVSEEKTKASSQSSQDNKLFTSPEVSKDKQNEDGMLFTSPFLSHKTQAKDAQPLFVSPEKQEMLFTSSFLSQKTQTKDAQPLFVSPEKQGMLFTSPSISKNNTLFTSPIKIPQAPKAPKVEQNKVQFLSSQISQNPTIPTIAADNIQLSLTGESNLGPQKVSLNDGNIGITTTQNLVPVSTTAQTNPSTIQQLIPVSTTAQTIPSTIQTLVPISTTAHTIPSTTQQVQIQEQPHQVLNIQEQFNKHNPFVNPEDIAAVNHIFGQQQHPGVQLEYGVPNGQTQIKTSNQGQPITAPEITKEQAFDQINKIQSDLSAFYNQNKQPISNEDRKKVFGEGVIDIREKTNNPLTIPINSFGVAIGNAGIGKSIQFGTSPTFQDRSDFGISQNFAQANPFQAQSGFSGYQQNIPNVKYEFSKDGFLNNYNGHGLTFHGTGGQTYSKINGQNTGFKETTKVEIVPAISFEITDHTGPNFQSFLGGFNSPQQTYPTQIGQQYQPSVGQYNSNNGQYGNNGQYSNNQGQYSNNQGQYSNNQGQHSNNQGQHSNNQGQYSSNKGQTYSHNGGHQQFDPSDVRYSTYQGPSSYLVPQKSVLQLPSDSGYHR